MLLAGSSTRTTRIVPPVAFVMDGSDGNPSTTRRTPPKDHVHYVKDDTRTTKDIGPFRESETTFR